MGPRHHAFVVRLTRSGSIAAGLLFVTIMVFGQSNAAFSDATTNSGNSFTASLAFSKDNDAVVPASDSCQTTYKLDQEDTDGDGTGDACDSSPTAPTAGTFTDSGQTLETDHAWAVAVDDTDGDRDVDIVNADKTVSKVWLHDGTGPSIDSGQSHGSHLDVVLGDVDRDGDLDIAYVATGSCGRHGEADACQQLRARFDAPSAGPR